MSSQTGSDGGIAQSGGAQSLDPRVRAQAELELRRRRGSNKFKNFQRCYKNRPLAFVHDCIDFPDGEQPHPYQDEILEELTVRRKIAVRSGHGAGKTALSAWITLWAVLTNDDCKVPTTASAWRQLTKYLWPEIHKWAAKLKWARICRDPFNLKTELQLLALKRGVTCEAFALASNNPALIEGAHAKRIIYVFDEAKAIESGVWDAAEGAFMGADSECYALAISTPGPPVGRFYDIHARKPGYEDWWVRHVTLAETLKAGVVTEDYVAQRKRQWGESSAVFQNRVLGEFATNEAEGVIPLAWVEMAIERWREWADAGKQIMPPMTSLGVDVARSGANDTIICPYYHPVVTSLKRQAHESTMATAGNVKVALDRYGGVAIVDVIGIGAGVVDRLREMGYDRNRVLAFNAAERTDIKQKSGEFGFLNKRSAAWWMMREILDPEGGDDIALPPDDDMIGELITPMWDETSRGQIKVESKSDVKKRLEGQRSTDRADAVIMAVVGPTLCQEYAGHVGTIEFPW